MFENVHIKSTRNWILPIIGYREDLVSGDLVQLSLTDCTGVTSYQWELVGRPEGSTAGGVGPEPVLLSTNQEANFIVDTDLVTMKLDGSYLVRCALNGGCPGNATLTALFVRVASSTLADGRNLRIPAAMESNEDTALVAVYQGYSKAINRWLQKLATTSSAMKRGWHGFREGNPVVGDLTLPHPDYVDYIGDDGPSSNPGPQAVVSDTLVASPFVISKVIQITHLLTASNGASNSALCKGYFAIYSNTLKGLYPQTRLWSAEQTAVATHGVIFSLAVSVTFQPGLYWLVSVFNAAAIAGGAALTCVETGHRAFPWFGDRSDFASTNIGVGWKHAFAYAQPPLAFPISAPVVFFAGTGGAGGSSYMPTGFLRFLEA